MDVSEHLQDRIKLLEDTVELLKDYNKFLKERNNDLKMQIIELQSGHFAALKRIAPIESCRESGE